MSPPRTAAEIREAFLSFFEKKQHTRVASSSLVPQNDPTILFTNAGMNQFKDVFTGRETRSYTRATTSQKCVRAGGKHNDLDNVGHTARHHTFFEMLGNFSFGDYFKKDAIAYAWEFITSKEWLGLEPSKLAVTIFEGEGKIPADTEAEAFWLAQGVRPERIFRLGKKDNFWSMGDVGPCGPCTEIHIFRGSETDLGFIDDHAKKFFAVPSQIADSDAWMELWNLVFMQFEVKAKGADMLPLPKPSIDTGAGLERLASVVQGVKTNYDTDLLSAIVSYAGSLAGKTQTQSTPDEIVAMRVIADHSRATAFLIADGVLPSNAGRGYVLRRIMRRAIRYGAKLGLNELFLFKTADKVIELMSAAYPELTEQRAFILKVARAEEESFRRTLANGLNLLNELIAMRKDDKTVIPGERVFFLHDTHGFPPDVTAQVAAEHGFTLDLDGYEAEMTIQKGKGGKKAKGGSDQKKVEDVYFELHGKHGESLFQGYDTVSVQGAKVLAILSNGAVVESASEGDDIEFVTDSSPFYGESGGQMGDAGTAKNEAATVDIKDAQKPVHGLIVHHGTVRTGELRVGAMVDLTVDEKRRDAVRANHSATHMLHKALKEVLGDHVKQAGSVVGPDLLRFDFSHFAPVTPAELKQIEQRVNAMVRDNRDAETKILSIEEAKKTGAVSMFGEKYGAVVRVVSVHPDSLEFCGGTHVRRSGDVGLFKLQSEGGIASGVRRIVALTGKAALDYVEELEDSTRAAAELLKGHPRELVQKTDAAMKRMKELEHELDALQKKMASAAAGNLMEKVRDVKGVKVLSARLEGNDPKAFREQADKIRDRLPSGLIVLGGAQDGKVLLLVAASDDVIQKGYKAGDLVKELAKDVGGKGGGKPDFAQAGGTDPSKLDAALERVYALI